MKVKILWTETHHYASIIDVPDAELTEWLEGAQPDTNLLLEFLKSGDETEWKVAKDRPVADYILIESELQDVEDFGESL